MRLTEDQQRLVEQWMPLVGHVVRRNHRPGEDWDEMTSRGNLALCRAVTGYDPSRDTTFQTYAYRSILYEIWRYRNRKKIKTMSLSNLDEFDLDSQIPLASDEPDPAVVFELQHDLNWLLAKLSPLQRETIVMRFLEGYRNLEIGEIQGKHPSAVHMVIRAALDNLRDMIERDCCG